MTSALEQITGRSATPEAAVLTACTLEATAPKAGNVHPEKSFDDLNYADFVAAARMASDAFADTSISVCQRALVAAEETAQRLQTNVNLGILLLLAPLIEADERNTISSESDWQPAVAEVLDRLTVDDSAALMRCIQVTAVGGLSTVDEMDVNETPLVSADIDIVAAMRLAQSRDRIAKQYADGFVDFFENVVPVVKTSLERSDDTLAGIADAHLRLLADDIDTLIQRKGGPEVAADVQRRARELDRSDAASVRQFDDFLRSDGNRLNPGTTADLIAAALYVLLRC